MPINTEPRWAAGLPPFVAETIRRAAAAHFTTPIAILRRRKQRDVNAARRQIVRELADDPRDFSVVLIGDWLNLDRSSVLYNLRAEARARHGKPRLPVPDAPFDLDVPDESGVWAI